MYRFAVNLLQPHVLLFLLTGLALALLWRSRREPRGRPVFLALSFGALVGVNTPAVSHLALGSLEWQFPPLEQRPADADAIVVLSSGLLPPVASGGRAELDEDSLRRCLFAARLYHQGRPCPVLVSGGQVDPGPEGPVCAELMGTFLVQLGVRASDLIVESSSRTTYENAVESAKLLEKHRLSRVLLVTDAVDLYRAVRCFRKQGVDPVPSPCYYRTGRFEWSLFTFLPSPGAALGCQRAWHEWCGVLWYRLQGRV
jgi:uncharacterized SAM-binding protein YcdF (DUF218 family)